MALPAPVAKGSGLRAAADDVLDPVVQRKAWELREAPQPAPQPRKKIRITLPELAAHADDSDDEEGGPVGAVKGPQGPSKLLSMLPAPAKTHGRSLPKPLARPPNGSNMPPPSKTTTASMVPHALRKKAPAPVPKDDEEDEDDGAVSGGNFFNIAEPAVQPGPSGPPPVEEEEGAVDDEYALPAELEYRTEEAEAEAQAPGSLIDPILRAPLRSDAEIHPSQMYNMAPGAAGPGPSTSSYVPPSHSSQSSVPGSPSLGGLLRWTGCTRGVQG